MWRAGILKSYSHVRTLFATFWPICMLFATSWKLAFTFVRYLQHLGALNFPLACYLQHLEALRTAYIVRYYLYTTYIYIYDLYTTNLLSLCPSPYPLVTYTPIHYPATTNTFSMHMYLLPIYYYILTICYLFTIYTLLMYIQPMY